jgi:hypothetical protein
MSSFTESVVEEAALAWLESIGWRVAHGPDIAPDMPAAERRDYVEVVLAQRLRDALAHASFIGFTGAPIELADANTRAVFGDYISVYDIQRAVSIRPDRSSATHQTSLEGSAKVVLTMNSREFRAQAKVAVRKGRRANGRSRRSGVSAFAAPSLESMLRECHRHGGRESDVIRPTWTERPNEKSR